MSVVRWGENGSDVYILKALNGWQCVACDGPGHFLVYDQLDMMTNRDLTPFLDHLKWHRERGDCVPACVDEELQRRNSPSIL